MSFAVMGIPMLSFFWPPHVAVIHKNVSVRCCLFNVLSCLKWMCYTENLYLDLFSYSFQRLGNLHTQSVIMQYVCFSFSGGDRGIRLQSST